MKLSLSQIPSGFVIMIIVLSCPASCEKEPDEILVLREKMPKQVSINATTTFELVLANLREVLYSEDREYGGGYHVWVEFSTGTMVRLNKIGLVSPPPPHPNRRMFTFYEKDLRDSLNLTMQWYTANFGSHTLKIEMKDFQDNIQYSYKHSFFVSDRLQLEFSDAIVEIPQESAEGGFTIYNREDYPQRVFYGTEDPWIELEYENSYDPDDMQYGGILLKTGDSFPVDFHIDRRFGYSGTNTGSIHFGSSPLKNSQNVEVTVDIPDSARMSFNTDTLQLFCMARDHLKNLVINKDGLGSLVWNMTENPYLASDITSGDATIEESKMQIGMNLQHAEEYKGGIVEGLLEFTINEKHTEQLPFILYNYVIYQDWLENDGMIIPEAGNYTPGPGVHKTVLLDHLGEFPREWLPASLEEAELIGILEHNKRVQEGTCRYGQGTTVVYTITRYSYRSRLDLYSIKTREKILTKTFYGEEPSPCPTESWRSYSINGEKVSYSTIRAYIEESIMQ